VYRRPASALCVALCLLVVGIAAATPPPSARQELRTCVDRWNQANMVGWGPALADVAVRRLRSHEQDHVGVYDRRPHCIVATADRLHEQTFVCVLNPAGAFWCSRYSDGAPPLERENARLDSHHVLRLDAPLVGTHAAPPLAWQRYPHVDGLIHPWTRSGKLRAGLTLESPGGKRYRGHCLHGSEYTRDPAALKCVSDVQFDACYAPTADWNRRGAVVACASEGSTHFGRFLITERS
jgi:hypothetical protein